MDNFNFSKNRHPFIIGLSLASTWAWGVSVIVGMQVFQQKGFLAYFIWALANSIALLIFGFITKKVNNARFISDLLPKTFIPIYRILILFIQFFSILVNLTAINQGIGMLGLPDFLGIVFSIILFLIILTKGFKGSIVMGSLQFIFVIGIAILVILLGGEHHIITHSNTEDIHWAIWSSLILISGPIVDQQIWQRRISTGHSISPFILSSFIFAFYMCLIGLMAYFGKMHSTLIGVIVIGVAGSTLVGALSAVGSYGKTIFQSRTWMVILFLMALMALVAKTNILNLWTFYGSIRVPFAIIAAFCIIIKTLKNN